MIVIKTKYTKFQLLLEGIAFFSLIVYVLFIIKAEGNLHNMKIDSLPIVAIILYALITIGSFFPKLWNIPWNYKNEKNGYDVYSTIKTMLISMKLEMVWYFFLVSYIKLTAKLSPIILDVFIFIFIATPVYFLIKSYDQAYK